MNKSWTSKLYIFTILLFTLGFFNIIFAWLGFLCMIIPFILLIKDKKKTWCQSYCPRANFLTLIFQRKSTSRTPNWIMKDKTKEFFLIYLGVNLFILFMSTLMVFIGRIDSIEKIRFMIAFELPWSMPQLLNIKSIPDWAVHLSFRVYSMMFSTTIIGMILALIYQPRTWCKICPVNTLSDIVLKKEDAK